MRRGVTLLAAGVTAFALVLSASVVYAYRAAAASRSAAPAVPAVAQPLSESGSKATSATQSQLSPRDAAALASTLVKRTDAYAVELTDWNGTAAYKVTFSSGDVAYLSLTGSLLAWVPNTSYVAFSGGSGGGGGGHGAQYHGSDSEDEHEHEQEVETEVEDGD